MKQRRQGSYTIHTRGHPSPVVGKPNVRPSEERGSTGARRPNVRLSIIQIKLVSINMVRTKGRGFTLIELLVVIAIIGILSAVVLASLSSSRGKARIAAAQSTMHSIQAGAVTCLLDGDVDLPTETQDGGGGG